MNTYLFSYEHQGARWCFQIVATDPADAQARLKRLAFATYDGELVAKVPAWLPAAPLFVRMWCAVANLFRSKT